MKVRHLILIALGCVVYLYDCAKVQIWPTGTQYVLRMVNFTQCTEVMKKPYLVDVVTNQYGLNQYMSCTAIVDEPIRIKRIMAHLERCKDYQFACESFQTWNITTFCRFAIMRNQFWSPIADSVLPTTWKRTCPTIEKGNYTLTNGTIDVNSWIRLYSEAAKYHWRGKVHVYDKHYQEQYCVYAIFYIASFNKRTKL